MVFLRGFIVWLVIMLAEVMHGMVRVTFLQPLVGDFPARQIAVFTGSVIILAITTTFIRWLGAVSVIQLLGVGLLWLFLTLGFEIILGRFVMGYGWERITSDYNLLKGGLLPIGLLILTLSPLVAAKIRGVIDQS